MKWGYLPFEGHRLVYVSPREQGPVCTAQYRPRRPVIRRASVHPKLFTGKTRIDRCTRALEINGLDNAPPRQPPAQLEGEAELEAVDGVHDERGERTRAEDGVRGAPRLGVLHEGTNGGLRQEKRNPNDGC